MGSHLKGTLRGHIGCGPHNKRRLFIVGSTPFVPLRVPFRWEPTHRYCFARSQLAFSFASVRARTHAQRDSYSNGEHSHYQLSLAQLVVRVLPIAIRVPLRMGSSSHGGERKGQLGPGETVPMSGLPPEGYPEGSRRVWTPHVWITKTKQKISLCTVNFAIIAKFRYDSKISLS